MPVDPPLCGPSGGINPAHGFMAKPKPKMKPRPHSATASDTLLKVRPSQLLSTGSTPFNLLCTGNPHGGLLVGKYVFMVGDSASGKTFLSMTCFAEACINPRFNAYRLIYDNIEDGMLMDLGAMFNSDVADRVEPPATRKGQPVYSDTAESFYYNVGKALFNAGWDIKKRKPSNVENPRPFVYVLDSENSLGGEADDEKYAKNMTAFEKRADKEAGVEPGDDQPRVEDEKIAGSFGDGKAKIHSSNIRRVLKGLRKTGSILIVLSQTRDNLSAYGDKKTRSGGRALKFYATVEVWSSVVKTHYKEINGKNRKIGARVKLETKKNRITGRLADTEIDFYFSVGLDDVGTCVDYLVGEKFWAVEGRKINAKQLGLSATRDKLISVIENKDLEDDVRKLCGQCWKNVEAQLALKRKNKYAKVTPETSDED